MNQLSWLQVALKSIWNRRLTSALTIISIALSIILLLTVNQVRRGGEEGFTQAISQVDLIVGARSGPLNLLLYTVFNMGSPSNNISWKTYEYFSQHPSVEWTIPYSLGDGHRGFRVVGTDARFFNHYRFRGGQQLQFSSGEYKDELWSVVLGATVARQLSYSLNHKVVLAHGATRGDGVIKHDDKPFHVTGILEPTGTVLDHSLYISLESMEGLHVDWQSGAVPTAATAIPAEQIKKEDLKVEQLTSFFLRTKSRIETLRLQREINTYEEEALSAIIPGVVLSELWRGLDYVDKSLKAISWIVVIVGFVGMMIALLAGLNERRREMAVFRALGAGPRVIFGLLFFESTLLTLMGVLLGLFIQGLVFLMVSQLLSLHFGIYLSAAWITWSEVLIVVFTGLIGSFMGLIPALRAYRHTLKDGLSVSI